MILGYDFVEERLFAEAGVSRELEDPTNDGSLIGFKRRYIKKLGREGYDDEEIVRKTKKRGRIIGGITGGTLGAIPGITGAAFTYMAGKSMGGKPGIIVPIISAAVPTAIGATTGALIGGKSSENIAKNMIDRTHLRKLLKEKEK
jgi:hypothetical protein